jgi:hypothetical protein
VNILHIIRQPTDATALAIAREQAKGHAVTLAFVHHVPVLPTGFATSVYVIEPRRPSVSGDTASIDYQRLIRLIVAHERVILW